MKQNSGFTLIEILIGMAIASIVMAAIFASFQAQVSAMNSQESSLDRNQAARAGLELMASEIRMAGCNPTATTGVGGFTAANSTDLEITMDFKRDPSSTTPNEPDGATDQPGEDVIYSLSAGNLMRERVGTDPAGGTLVVSGVDALDFVYLNSTNAVMVIATSDDLADIRSVEISMVVRSIQQQELMVAYFVDYDREYKNQRDAVILAAQHDTNRRILLSTTVQCRNMGR